MGPWPGLEPGPAGPQPTVLTATLPQPWVHLQRLLYFIPSAKNPSNNQEFETRGRANVQT